jgi:Fe-S-cluster-containing hydrogenase component 2
MSDHSGPFLLVNPDRCMGCHTCEVVCAVAHSRAGDLSAAMVAGETLSARNRVVQVATTRFPNAMPAMRGCALREGMSDRSDLSDGNLYRRQS